MSPTLDGLQLPAPPWPVSHSVGTESFVAESASIAGMSDLLFKQATLGLGHSMAGPFEAVLLPTACTSCDTSTSFSQLATSGVAAGRAAEPSKAAGTSSVKPSGMLRCFGRLCSGKEPIAETEQPAGVTGKVAQTNTLDGREHPVQQVQSVVRHQPWQVDHLPETQTEPVLLQHSWHGNEKANSVNAGYQAPGSRSRLSNPQLLTVPACTEQQALQALWASQYRTNSGTAPRSIDSTVSTFTEASQGQGRASPSKTGSTPAVPVRRSASRLINQVPGPALQRGSSQQLQQLNQSDILPTVQIQCPNSTETRSAAPQPVRRPPRKAASTVADVLLAGLKIRSIPSLSGSDGLGSPRTPESARRGSVHLTPNSHWRRPLYKAASATPMFVLGEVHTCNSPHMVISGSPPPAFDVGEMQMCSTPHLEIPGLFQSAGKGSSSQDTVNEQQQVEKLSNPASDTLCKVASQSEVTLQVVTDKQQERRGGQYASNTTAGGHAVPSVANPWSMLRQTMVAGAGGGTRLIMVSDRLPSSMNTQQWCMDSFQVQKRLYKGHVGSVFRACCLNSGQVVVLKVYAKARLTPLHRGQIDREVRIHGVLHHKHVVELYAAFETAELLVLVQEFAPGGDLFTCIQKAGGRMKPAEAARKVIGPVVSMFCYLHSLGIIHRDLKPENLVLASGGVIKLTDFGAAINMNEEKAVTRIGTQDYMAPEVRTCPRKQHMSDHKERSDIAYNTTADIWSVGILAYELMVGMAPSVAMGRPLAKAAAAFIQRMPFPKSLPPEARDFIEVAAAERSVDRPTAVELMQHAWLQDALDA